jgi:hypothetical protein
MGGIVTDNGTVSEVLARDKFGKELGEGDVVEFEVYGPGPGRPYQQPEGILRCFIVLIDKVGEIYLDPRCDRDHKHVIMKAAVDSTVEELEEINWLMMCGNSEEEIRLIGKAIKV